jgi:MFS family permease
MISHTDEDATAGPSPASLLTSGRRALLIAAIFAGNFAAALLYDVLPPIMSNLAAAFGGGEHGQFLAQLASSLPLLGVMVAGLFAGPVIERFGIRTTLIFAMIGFAVTGTAGVAIDTAWPLIGTRILMGFCAGLMTTSCISLIALFFRGTGRGRMNGWLVSSGAVAGIGFVLIAGAVAHWWWKAPFLLHAAVALAFLLPIIALPHIAAEPKIESGFGGHLKRLGGMVPVYITGFVLFVLMLVTGTQTPFLLAAAGFGDHSVLANLFAINAAALTIASIGYGQVSGRVTPTTALRVAFLLIAASMALLGWADSYGDFLVAMTLGGAAIGLALSALWTWAMRRAPHDLVPRALGLMTTCTYLGGAVSPFVFAPLRQSAGLAGQYLVAAVIVTVGVALSLLLRSRTRLAVA